MKKRHYALASIEAMIILFIVYLTSCSKINDCLLECTLEPDPGDCKASITKYYYSTKHNKCKPFEWGGCNGVVPFETLEDCQNCNC